MPLRSPPPAETVDADTLLQRTTSLHHLSHRLWQAEQRVQELADQLTDTIKQYEQLLEPHRTKQQRIIQVQQLRTHVAAEEQRCNDQKAQTQYVRDKLLTPRQQHLAEHRKLLSDELLPSLATRRDTYQKSVSSHHELQRYHAMRQQHFFYNLHNVYPITPSKMLINGVPTTQGIYAIRQLKLPLHSLHYYDEMHLSTALGFICQLVLAIAKYCNIRLRYRLIYNGSRSCVADEAPNLHQPAALQHAADVAPSFTSSAVILPLYFQYQELRRFEWACVLLHRDIEQICCARIADYEKVAPKPPSMLQSLRLLFRHELPI